MAHNPTSKPHEKMGNLPDKLAEILERFIFPICLFVLITGMFWSDSRNSFNRIFIIFIVLPGILFLLVRPRVVRIVVRSEIVFIALVFMGYAMLSLAWATPEESPVSLMRRPLMAFLLFVIMVGISLGRPDTLKQTLKASVIVATVVALLTIVMHISKQSPRLVGYGALYNPLLVSHVFGFFAALTLGKYFSEKQWVNRYALVIILVLASLLFATGSRTPLVALFATIVWLGLLSGDKRAMIPIGAMVALVMLAFVLWPDVLLKRGLSYRPQIWSDAIRQISEAPWFGHGFNSPIRIKLPEINYPFHDPHNLTLAVAYHLGVVGVALWLTLYAKALLQAWKLRSEAYVVVASAPVVYGFFAGMTEGGAYFSRPKEHWFLIWIPLALLAGAICNAQRRS